MTISTNITRDEYTATAGQTVFTYTFKIFESTDLNVYVTPVGQEADDSADIVTPSVVTGVGEEAGGTITIAATTLGDLVTIVSDIAQDREIDYQVNGDFTPPVVNSDFDRTVSLVKQLSDEIDRSLKYEQSEQGVSGLTLPAPSDGLYLRWLPDLTGLENAGAPSVVYIKEPYASIADLKVSTNLSINDVVETTAYYSTAVGGGGKYLIVAAGTGTDDGGSYIDLPASSLQAKLIINSAELSFHQWGVTGDLVSDDKTIIDSMVTFAGGAEYTFICDISTTIKTDIVIPANIKIKFIRGSVFNIDVGNVINHLGTIEAGEYKIFLGSGTIIFSSTVAFSPATDGRQGTLYAAWWGDPTVDVGASISSAATSIRYRGGTILLPGTPMLQTTSANVTDTTRGVIIQGQSSGGFNFAMIDCQCTGKAAFDLTKSSSVTFINVGVNGHATNMPFTALLLARDTTGASYGNHIINNFATSGKFQGAAVYNYGSEVVDMNDCQLQNTVDAGRVIVHTYINSFGASSDFQTIATGAQSNSTFKINGGEILATGTGNTDGIYLEGSTDFKIDGTFISVGLGRSMFYVDNDTSGSDKIQIQNLRGEVSASKPTYGIYFSADQTCAFWSIENVGFDCDTNAIKAAGNMIASDWRLSGWNDVNNAGISLYQVNYSVLELGTGTFATSNTTYRSILTGIETNIAMTVNSQSYIMDMSNGGQISPLHRFDDDGIGSSAESSMMLLDVNKGTLQRVSFGAGGSGGTGFKLLRIAN